MNRRQFVKNSAVLSAALALTNHSLFALSDNKNPYSFVNTMQSPLSYKFGELQPVIQEQIMELHYTKHAAGYLKNLNTYLSTNKIINVNLFDMMQGDLSNPTLRNNLGGHFNHELFWRCMIPVSNENIPDPLNKKIIQDFGSIDEFKKQFTEAANKVFGSGWAWLSLDISKQKLIISTTANQNNPLNQDEPKRGYPILGLDVWEHAYYLQYQNRRAEYTAAFWKIVNWNFIILCF